MNSHKYQGLSDSEITLLEKKFGKNILAEIKGPSLFYIFINQFKSPLVYTLVIASFLSLYFKEYVNFWTIFAVILVNSMMGFYQEFSAKKTLSALKKMLQPVAATIRNGKRIETEARNLLPGDIVILAAGDQIPADGKIIEATNLLVNEAILTGEQDAVDKKPEKSALLFMGTIVLSGVGIMQVDKIGTETEIGKINQGLSEIKESKTPLEKKLAKFSRDLVLLVLAISAIILVLGVLDGRNFWSVLELSIVLAVAAIPEGLPIAATVILSLGMKRILQKKGLTKRLLSIETLGATSVICTDKTGTLTEGKMQVVKTDLENDLHANYSLILANQQKDTLEVCLWQYVEKNSKIEPKEILNSVEKIYEEPFDSIKKYSLSIVNQDEREIGYVLGAPEIILNFCDVNSEKKKEIILKISNWANLGLKIVGAAYKSRGEIKEKSRWQWLGIIGIEDPLRPEVVETVKKFENAGIKVKIVTGDYRETAVNVAKSIGLGWGSENIMEASELETISDFDLKEKIDQITVFSRITPQQKLKIVNALQERDEIVAMTGDGVNDALALKKADIAVVVANASDVAKEVSDLILLDSNFKTIYAACEEGRTILANIKKVVSFVLSNSFLGIAVIFASVVLNLPAPLTVLMVLWINLICDGPIDIMLGFEEGEPERMRHTPKSIKDEKIIDRFVVQTSVLISSSVGLFAALIFSYNLNKYSDLNFARTVAFATVASSGLIYVFAFKNLHKPIHKYKNLLNNRYLNYSVIYGAVLVLAVIYLPFLNGLFETKPIGIIYWIYVLVVGLFGITIAEVSKISYRKSKKVPI